MYTCHKKMLMALEMLDAILAEQLTNSMHNRNAMYRSRVERDCYERYLLLSRSQQCISHDLEGVSLSCE